MPVLVATDLDRTLIYSRRFVAQGADVVAVERYRDEDASYLTSRAASVLTSLGARALIVPTTTRTVSQLARVRLPGPPARYAVAANGGVLLVDGAPDPGWGRSVAASLAAVASLAEVRTHVEAGCRPEWTSAVRDADGLFCYAVIDPDALPGGFAAETSSWAAARGWQVSLQGRKIYWVPRTLTKSAAVAEITRREGTQRTLAAGDSLLDADLLEAADAGIAARHGELVASGWSAPHVGVTAESGLAAGEEIVRFFATAVPLAP